MVRCVRVILHQPPSLTRRALRGHTHLSSALHRSCEHWCACYVAGTVYACSLQARAAAQCVCTHAPVSDLPAQQAPAPYTGLRGAVATAALPQPTTDLELTAPPPNGGRVVFGATESSPKRVAWVPPATPTKYARAAADPFASTGAWK
jgi:hypothetical protein